ncbi:RNB domain-containing ribonuclease [Sphingomonas sp. URHD0057]|uniref:RNB domain-containing ribonuclease n=1 Tax=Sphingomonas sp. URHD0057 TaxID=1380389 RepID=UPI00048F3764|nr:RNB domain-containing ribonuclease [Sphingomonas sp. URHD0057]
MKALYDRPRALADGLAAIRVQFQLPAAFPPLVLDAAATAARRQPTGYVDRTALPFVTLDPTSSTDLDQAFAIEAAGGDLILRYAIADVGAFVDDGDALDTEAWTRGETIYLPDGKVSLYPPVIGEGVASLLPDGDRPAILFSVRVQPDGTALLDGVERALIRSRAKLGYATVRPEDLPAGFDELARRIADAEAARGAARVDPPQQEVVESADGGFELAFRPMNAMEQANAALSLAANLAVASALYEHATGLFRVMPGPDERAIRRLRQSARALGVEWPKDVSLEQREIGLDPNDPKQAAFMLAIRRAGQRASYAPFHVGERPWHSAMQATYVHATAPLRRLADRYVTQAALAIANGKPVPEAVGAAFERLPDIMNRADAKTAQVDSAALELAEAIVLADQVGKIFDGRVTDLDQRGARIQIADPAVITRVPENGRHIGDAVRLRLGEADPARRLTRFTLV